MKRNCLVCGADMEARPDKIALGEGKYCSQQCHGKAKLGEDNPMWAGKEATYHAVHRYIERRITKPDTCPRCGNAGWLDLHNRDSNYSRNLRDWEWLCRRCHMKIDGRMTRRQGGKYAPKAADSADGESGHVESIFALH